MRRDRDGSAGFSLVEVLATLAVAGAILTALASTVSLLTRHADRVATDAQTRELVDRSLATLAHAIEGTARQRWAGEGRGFIFAGTRDTLVFAFDQRERATIRTRIVRIQSIAEADGFALLWSEGPFTPNLRDVSQVAFSLPRRLPTGGSKLRFAFVTSGTVQLPEVLTDDWPAEDALPEAVRLALIDPSSGQIRSSLRVPLRATAEPGCLSPGRALCSRFDERKAAEGAPHEGRR